MNSVLRLRLDLNGKLKLNFRLLHLFAIITGFAVVFALIEWSMLAATIVSVVVFGPTVAHATSAKTSAFVPGMLSAAFWTFVATVFVAVLLPRDNFSELGISYSQWFISIPIAASMIGGYIGARIALH